MSDGIRDKKIAERMKPIAELVNSGKINVMRKWPKHDQYGRYNPAIEGEFEVVQPKQLEKL